MVTPKFEWDFGNQGSDVEWVEAVKWKGGGSGVFGPNLAASSGVAGGGCGGAPNEFWGQSYGNADSQGPGPVIAASRGSWDPRGHRTVEIGSIAPEACSGDTPPIPVRTRYTFFDEGASANTVRLERRWSFSPLQEPYAVQGMRAYVPRLSAGTYNQEIYPKDDGTLVTEGLCDVCIRTGSLANDWNQTWVAINASSTGSGLLILRDPANPSPASVTLDYDGSSGSNNTGITLDRPLPSGWLAPLAETEFLCFYDNTTWPPLERSATRLPDGCAPAAAPINTAPPALSAGAGNPRTGEAFYASAGSWDNVTGPFAYQWSRCLGSACQAIPGATGTSYTATAADAGRSLKVAVTATAPGGLTDVAESNLAGAVSGHVYEGSKTGPTVAGAPVQVCRRSGSPCRSTVTDGTGLYRVQAPLVGKYRVTAFPPAGSNAVSRTRPTITRVKAEAEKTGQDVVLGAVKPPPPEVSFGGSGVRGKSAEGVPVVHWQEPFVIDYETDIDNEVEARVEFGDGQVLRVDPQQPVEPSPKNPEDGIFRFPIQPLFPNHGAARVTIVVHAPRSVVEIEQEEAEAEEEEAEEEEDEEEEDEEEEENEEEDEEPEEEEEDEEEEQEEEETEDEEEEDEENEEEEGPGPGPGGPEEETTFPIYIDPSGFVHTVGGAPLGGATVTLFQSQAKSGPFSVVANGSAVMSPMNRVNPDLSEADGHFGWDVIAGFYKVRVEKGGCHAPGDGGRSFVETAVMTIPPPVTNLDLRLECPPLVGGPGPNALARPRPRVALALGGGTIKVAKDGRFKAPAATVECPTGASGPCAVEVLVSVPTPPKRKPGKSRRAKTAVTIGGAKLSVAAGKSAGLEGKLSGSGLKRLEKLRRLKATIAVSATAPGGDGGEGSFVATLLAPPKPKPHHRR